MNGLMNGLMDGLTLFATFNNFSAILCRSVKEPRYNIQCTSTGIWGPFASKLTNFLTHISGRDNSDTLYLVEGLPNWQTFSHTLVDPNTISNPRRQEVENIVTLSVMLKQLNRDDPWKLYVIFVPLPKIL
jgi:hypothetical protein